MKTREYTLHDDILKEYGIASINNAQQLLDDARILLINKSFARAYFLAVAAIEETGKAYIAHAARGRNLSDDGLVKKIQDMFENHSSKISSAFACWISNASKQEESSKAAVDLIINLKNGRESSMYVDVNSDNSLSIPSKIVSPSAAVGSINVAKNCLYHTISRISGSHVSLYSSFEDKLFCLNSNKIKEIFSNDDFGEYILSELNKTLGHFNLPRTIVTYHDKY
ncbi:AbiV family abortive infection protein [Gammaproteobacteria bacterium]